MSFLWNILGPRFGPEDMTLCPLRILGNSRFALSAKRHSKVQHVPKAEYPTRSILPAMGTSIESFRRAGAPVSVVLE